MAKFDFSSEFFNAESTLECGQIFRFIPYKEGYKVFSKDKTCYVHTAGDKTIIECDDVDYFYNYFDLNRDYSEIYKNALSFGIPFLSDCANVGKGIRILNQDEEEMIYSFIISQNNHIPRIKGIISRICEDIGEDKSFLGENYKTFPKTEALAARDAEYYRGIGAGYRDVFLSETAKRIKEEGIEELKTLPTFELKKRLLTYKGIGPKVADCVSLFGFSRTDSFPVDTWIMKVYKEDFKGELTDKNKITAYFEEKFKDNAGFIQQYLFYGKRNMKL